jgi:hypothetical protein
VNTIDSSERLLAWTPVACPCPRATLRRRAGLAAISALAGALFATASARADEAPAPVETAPPLAAEPLPPSEPPVAAVPPAPAPADTTTVAKVAAPPVPVTPPAPPPPPYSLPWQMRPLTVGNVIRSDTSVAFYKDAAGNTGSTEASMLLASYKITPEIAPIVRLGWVKNDAPAVGADGNSFVNPIVAAAYSHKLDSFRLAGFLGTTIPIGQGAGQTPNAGAAAADAAGINARSGMDNAMFAVNYMTAIAGVGFGYVSKGFTAQVEATVFQLFRVRGNDMTASAPDAARTNSTAAVGGWRASVSALAVDAQPPCDGREDALRRRQPGQRHLRGGAACALQAQQDHGAAPGNLVRAGSGQAAVRCEVPRGPGRYPVRVLGRA